MHISFNYDHPKQFETGVWVPYFGTNNHSGPFLRAGRQVFIYFFKLHYKNVYLRKASFNNDIKSALTYSYNMSGMSSFNLTNVFFAKNKI